MLAVGGDLRYGSLEQAVDDGRIGAVKLGFAHVLVLAAVGVEK